MIWNLFDSIFPLTEHHIQDISNKLVGEIILWPKVYFEEFSFQRNYGTTGSREVKLRNCCIKMSCQVLSTVVFPSIDWPRLVNNVFFFLFVSKGRRNYYERLGKSILFHTLTCHYISMLVTINWKIKCDSFNSIFFCFLHSAKSSKRVT